MSREQHPKSKDGKLTYAFIECPDGSGGMRS